MKGRLTKDEEDSGSDWDSMSEMEPPPKKSDPMKAMISSSQGHAAAVPRKLKSMTFVDPEVGKQYGGDKPPFDFKGEVTSPIRVVQEKPPKPGKPKKGKMYDPQDAPQRRVSFADESNVSKDKPVMNGVVTGLDSDSEDPLYSTVKRRPPESASQGSNVDKHNQEKEISGKPSALKKSSKSTSESKQRDLQGVENQAYVGDEEVPTSKPADFHIQEGRKTSGSYGKSVQKPERIVREKSSDINSRVVSIVEKECTPPLIMTLGQTSVELAGKKPVEAVNRAMAEACTFLAFPLICLSLFLHHFVRLVLLGLIRPLVVDTLVLLVEYLLRPLMNSVVKPMLISLYGASSSFSDIVIVCLRPVTTLLQSFRLVEIQYTRKYSVEEI